MEPLQDKPRFVTWHVDTIANALPTKQDAITEAINRVQKAKGGVVSSNGICYVLKVLKVVKRMPAPVQVEDF